MSKPYDLMFSRLSERLQNTLQRPQSIQDASMSHVTAPLMIGSLVRARQLVERHVLKVHAHKLSPDDNMTDDYECGTQ